MKTGRLGNVATGKECPGAGGGEEGGSPEAFGGNEVLPTALLRDSGYQRCENKRVCLRLAGLPDTDVHTVVLQIFCGAHVLTPRSPGRPVGGGRPSPQIHGGH